MSGEALRLHTAIGAIALAAILAVPASAQLAPCTGDACFMVDLTVVDRCVWLESRADRPVAATVTIGSRTEAVGLEAADAAKVATHGSALLGPGPIRAGRQRAECLQIVHAARSLEEMRARGSNVPFNPIVDGRAEWCRDFLANAEREEAAAQSTARSPHHAMRPAAPSTAPTPVYRAPVPAMVGCLAALRDVTAYTANFDVAR